MKIIMKIIGGIIVIPFMCIFGPFLFLAACPEEFIKIWEKK